MLLHVTCAVIRRNGKFLAAQRSASMSRPMQWEFPGGKVDGAETPEECIVREIKEEMCLDVRPLHRLPESTYSYGDKTIHLIPFECAIEAGVLTNTEHNKVAWMSPQEMRQLDWCDADRVVVEQVLEESVHAQDRIETTILDVGERGGKPSGLGTMAST